MLDNGQIQKAGDNSQLVQGNHIVIQNGIDEKRVREIFDEKTLELVEKFTVEAYDLIRERVKKFGEDLIPKLVKEGILEALREPSVQILLRDAQMSAASTKRQSDYSLLSELLIRRIKNGDNYYIKSGVSGAIKIVDEVSDEALLGLTVLYSVGYFVPFSQGVLEGINILNHLFSSIVYDTLPEGVQWLEQLDILKAVRFSSLFTLESCENYYSRKLSGYIDVGIEKDSADYDKALEIIQEVQLPQDILCDHELRRGYVRLKMINPNNIDSISLCQSSPFLINSKSFTAEVVIKLSDEQKQAIKRIYALYDTDSERRKENITEFFRLWDNFEILKRVKTWWNNVPGASITPVGKSLAHANAQKYFPSLPEFYSE